MQDNNWDGITLPGFAGTGKTEWAKALGHEAGGMFLSMDLGGAKGGIVGDSERMIRQALSMLKAMGGENVMFVATCNDMSILQRKPELLRRLAYGIHFFDLPTKEEQVPIWDLYMKKFELPKQELPACDGWTGAEIKKVCKLADEFGLPLTQVAGRITPVCRTMGDGVKRLRDQAEKGGWLSAKTGSPYTARNSMSMKEVRKVVAN
jgi:AAA+ superfamily predicted ATPase